MTPQTNNAYNGSLRDIVFPAAILQAPVFDPNADPAFNYGAVGGVIGHELTHGFDDQGRSIDAAGALRDWWTPKDAAAFKARAAVLGAQYAKFEPVPGVFINPDLTMGENLADLGGLAMALDAYRVSLKGQLAPVLNGLTGDQRVFLGWAQAWAGKANPEEIKRYTTSDPHSFRRRDRPATTARTGLRCSTPSSVSTLLSMFTRQSSADEPAGPARCWSGSVRIDRPRSRRREIRRPPTSVRSSGNARSAPRSCAPLRGAHWQGARRA
ncbi:MAG: M13-type metalloendopeptidase [Sphingomicrobium sp.]